MPRSLREGMTEDFFFFFFWSGVERADEARVLSSAFEEMEELLEFAEGVCWRVGFDGGGCALLEAAFLGSTYFTLMRILLRRAAGEGRLAGGSEGILTR